MLTPLAFFELDLGQILGAVLPCSYSMTMYYRLILSIIDQCLDTLFAYLDAMFGHRGL
mgnify:FL=1